MSQATAVTSALLAPFVSPAAPEAKEVSPTDTCGAVAPLGSVGNRSLGWRAGWSTAASMLEGARARARRVAPVSPACETPNGRAEGGAGVTEEREGGLLWRRTDSSSVLRQFDSSFAW